MYNIYFQNNNGESVPLDKDDIQQAVNSANLEADTEYQSMFVCLI